jgi:hypothetical protein
MVRFGAVCSVIGTAILVTLIIVLLAYPVSKYCENNVENCEFISDSPEPLRGIVQPVTLVTSLIVIAVGILLLRIGMWSRARNIR